MDADDSRAEDSPAEQIPRHPRGELLMALLGWVMMGLAIWHYTIFLPDRFWGGIVGALIGALVGAIVIGFLIAGLQIPGEKETDVAVVLYAVPGAIVGMALVYFEGIRREGPKIEADLSV